MSAIRLGLIDTHAHLDSPKFAGDLADVLARARDAGVVQIIAIGTTAEDSQRVVALAQKFANVFAAVGIHPNDAAEAAEKDWETIVALSHAPKVVALGETGLDRYWDRTPFAIQQDFFDRHLRLSFETNLPVVIHSRDCQRDIIQQLASHNRPIRAVQHSFTGTLEEANELLALGLDISFAGMITFENKTLDALREVAAKIPLDRLLVETDSPYLSPHPFRGKRNEPARVALTAQVVAAQRGLSLEKLAQATSANSRRLFGLPTPISLN